MSQSTIVRLMHSVDVKPDSIEVLPNGRKRFLYGKKKLTKLAWELRKHRRAKASIKGPRRRCHHCKTLLPQSSLISGLCTTCRARKTALNFAYDNDPLLKPYSPKAADELYKAIRAIIRSH